MSTESRITTINLRTSVETRALIDSAAKALGMNRTDFMLDTLCQRAHEVLADRTHFQLDGRKFAEFNSLLDKPVSPAALGMLAKRAPWG